MFNTVCWNIRGLNDPVKQREIRSFIKLNNVSLMGTIETRVKFPNFTKVSKAIAPSWSFYP